MHIFPPYFGYVAALPSNTPERNRNPFLWQGVRDLKRSWYDATSWLPSNSSSTWNFKYWPMFTPCIFLTDDEVTNKTHSQQYAHCMVSRSLGAPVKWIGVFKFFFITDSVDSACSNSYVEILPVTLVKCVLWADTNFNQDAVIFIERRLYRQQCRTCQSVTSTTLKVAK